MHNQSTVVFVTGVTSGIGASIAHHLSGLGYQVIGSTRKKQDSHSKAFEWVTMDITDIESVRAAVAHIIAKYGRIDVLVNNAGIGLAGSLEETPGELALQVLDTNLIGLHRVCRTVAPHMRAQKSGKIINIGSIGGMIGLPYRGFYIASKFATEGFSESLSMELQQFGIWVSLVQPGDMKTNINDNRLEIETQPESAYHLNYQHTRKVIRESVNKGQDPIAVAKCVAKIIGQKKPAFRYRVGLPFEHFTLMVKRTIPFRWFEKIVLRYYKVK